MTERKSCVRCGRAIDAIAHICPFCNWDQEQPVTAEAAETQVPVYVPPAERGWRKRILIALGLIAVLIASFAVGMVVNRDGTPDDAPEPLTDKSKTTTGAAAPQNAPPLIEMDTTVETPITSAPVPVADAGSATNDYQRADATAVSSVEYDQLAQRAAAERKKREQMAAMTDPRSITGAAYAQTPRPAAPRPKPAPRPGTVPDQQNGDQQQAQQTPPQERAREARSSSVRTRPVPRYTPLPTISVARTTVAKVDLLVGADGLVREVNIRDGIPGHTAQLIAAIQNWRFKPATENGEPVSAQTTVDISFRGNE
ncbi:MAG TPA: energy transducer TonB [Thermoanaerobaculia bacterium]